jgi:ribosomal protein L19
MNLIESLERQLEPNPNIPELRPGDTVKVHARIVEGDRERVQVFQGIIIRLHAGGANTNFTVRRIASHGIGVERTFLHIRRASRRSRYCDGLTSVMPNSTTCGSDAASTLACGRNVLSSPVRPFLNQPGAGVGVSYAPFCVKSPPAVGQTSPPCHLA